MNKFIIALLLSTVCVFYISKGYSEEIVFEGTPLVSNNSSTEQSFNKPVEKSDQINYKLVITKDGNEYLWFSREKKKLTHTKSGAFDYFISPDGSGYIKVSQNEDGKYLYLEHMSLGFDTITYWGVGEKFKE